MRIPHFSMAGWIWLSALAALAAALLWLVWPRATVVEAGIIDRGEVRREIEEEGQTRIRDAFNITAPVGGLLQRVELRPGDAVHAGDVLATLIPSPPALLDARAEKEAIAMVSAAQSALSAAEADEQLALAQEQRTAVLFRNEYASKAARDRAEAASATARALVGQRQAELRRARAALAGLAPRGKKVVVRSPSSGRVLQVMQESEMTVAPGTLLLQVGDLTDMEIVAEYLSQDAAEITEGACAFIQRPGRPPVTAHVQTIEPFARTKLSALGVEEQRVNVVLRADADLAVRERLGHGYKVDVRVVAFIQEDALRTPTDALVRTGNGGWAVFRISDGRARLTPVKIGQGDDRFRVIEEGLSPGDRVILFPGDTIRDGDRVRAGA